MVPFARSAGLIACLALVADVRSADASSDDEDRLFPPTPFEVELELAVGLPLDEIRQKVAHLRLDAVHACIEARGFHIDSQTVDHIAGVPLGIQEEVAAATAGETGSTWGGATVDYAVVAQQTFDQTIPADDSSDNETEFAILECLTAAEMSINPLGPYDRWLQEVVVGQVDDAVRADPRFQEGRDQIDACLKAVGIPAGDLGQYLSSITSEVDDAYVDWRAGITSEETRDSIVAEVRERAEVIGPSLWDCQRDFEEVHFEIIEEVQENLLEELGPSLSQVGQEIRSNLDDLGLS